MKKLIISAILFYPIASHCASPNKIPVYQQQARINAQKAKTFQHQTVKPVAIVHDSQNHHLWEMGVEIGSHTLSGRRITELTCFLGTTLNQEQLQNVRKIHPRFNDFLFTISPFLNTVLKSASLPDESDAYTGTIILVDQQNKVLDTIELNMKNNNEWYEAVESSYKGVESVQKAK